MQFNRKKEAGREQADGGRGWRRGGGVQSPPETQSWWTPASHGDPVIPGPVWASTGTACTCVLQSRLGCVPPPTRRAPSRHRAGPLPPTRTSQGRGWDPGIREQL